MLKVVSTRLTGIIRASDTLARIGGDEFILMMLETLTKKLDAAMYYSKNYGRNQFKFFGDDDVQVE